MSLDDIGEGGVSIVGRRNIRRNTGMGEPGFDPDSRLAKLAREHGFGLEAVSCLHRALSAGHGMAQFSHPELGGLGQWAGGGMTMIGAMGNPELRRRVGALCEALSVLPRDADAKHPDPAGASRPAPDATAPREPGPWWPEGLGTASSTGTQGEVAYAWFPQARRLAVRHGGRVRVYDTGAHAITGLSQGSGAGRPVRLQAGEREIDLADLAPAETAARDRTPPRAPDAGAADRPQDPLATIERLAGLRAAGVLTQEEFTAKKTELLARL